MSRFSAVVWSMHLIFIYADACPVKEETYKVAIRYSMRVEIVANAIMRVPGNPLFQLVVKPGFGTADDHIAEHCGPGDLVITSDIPLAARCIEKKALVLNPKGNQLTEDDIGEALAMRNLMEELRQSQVVGGGPAPMTPRDRSRFLSTLDQLINSLKRNHPRP